MRVWLGYIGHNVIFGYQYEEYKNYVDFPNMAKTFTCYSNQNCYLS